MPDRPRFGPAGIPCKFKELKTATSELPSFLKEEGLDAFEYEAVRWGKKPQIKPDEAEKLGFNARNNDIWLTLHGSYYINFLGNKEIVEASKRRLIACTKAANWLNAHTVVFHLGYYSQKYSHKEDLHQCIKTLNEFVSTVKALGLKAKLGPEISGKLAQIGSLDEILTICENVEQTQPVVDWAHLHARQRGGIRTAADYTLVIEQIEKRLGTSAAKNLHCHFSSVEYTFRGERRHHPLNTLNYGPKFESFADAMVSLNLKPVVISETPLLDADAKKMRNIFYKRLGNPEAIVG